MTAINIIRELADYIAWGEITPETEVKFLVKFPNGDHASDILSLYELEIHAEGPVLTAETPK